MLAFRARYVFPVDGPPLRNAIVAIDHDRIVAVGDASSTVASEFGAAALDLGSVAILPGLINAHTHLEFSDLGQPLGTPGMAFADWIRLVVRNRRERTADVDAIGLGVAESSAFGVTAVGEIASTPWRRASLPLEVTQFCEIIALKSGADDARYRGAVDAVTSSDSRWTELLRPALSPHAPYTVRPELILELAQLSAQRQIPLTLHLAETREELALLRDGNGPLVEMLEAFGQWDPAAIPARSRPLDYLRMLAKGHRSLAIHGNYFDPEEIEFAAQHSDRLSVVYCPRTHTFFRHDPYPLAKMLSAGVNVALGTDSRASNPDLSIFAEFQFAARQHPAVAPADLLRAMTLSAARAFGREQDIGSIRTGKFADLAVVTLPEFTAADPHELLFDSASRPTATVFRGKTVAQSVQYTPRR